MDKRRQLYLVFEISFEDIWQNRSDCRQGNTSLFKSLKVKNFVKKLKGKIVLWPLPKRLPELNPMEPGWKSARKNVTYKLFDNKKTLGRAVKAIFNGSLRSI